MSGARRECDDTRLEWLCQRLEEAGATLLALPQRGMGPQLRQVRWPEGREEGSDITGTSPTKSGAQRLRAPPPNAAEISRMDEVFGWVGLIPQDRVVLRRIVHARALVSPLTGRHLYSWRQVAALIGADHRAVQRWHAKGLRLILAGLYRLGKISC